MRLVCTNRSTGSHRLQVANLDVPVNATKYMVGRTPQEAAFAMDQSTAAFSVAVHFDPSDQGYTQVTYWLAVMAGPVSGASPLAGVGLTIKDVTAATTQTVVEPIGLALFDDAGCTVPSVKATFSSVQTGTLTSGVGTNAIETTTAAGVLLATVARKATVGAGAVVFAKAFSLGTKSTAGASTHIVDSHQTQQVTLN